MAYIFIVIYIEWWRVYMSLESAKRFLLCVESDPSILDEISDSIDKAETDDEKISVIVSFAQKTGYDFTALDIKTVSSEIGNVDDNQYEVYGGVSNLRRKYFSKFGFTKRE